MTGGLIAAIGADAAWVLSYDEQHPWTAEAVWILFEDPPDEGFGDIFGYDAFLSWCRFLRTEETANALVWVWTGWI